MFCTEESAQQASREEQLRIWQEKRRKEKEAKNNSNSNGKRKVVVVKTRNAKSSSNRNDVSASHKNTFRTPSPTTNVLPKKKPGIPKTRKSAPSSTLLADKTKSLINSGNVQHQQGKSQSDSKVKSRQRLLSSTVSSSRRASNVSTTVTQVGSTAEKKTPILVPNSGASKKNPRPAASSSSSGRRRSSLLYKTPITEGSALTRNFSALEKNRGNLNTRRGTRLPYRLSSSSNSAIISDFKSSSTPGPSGRTLEIGDTPTDECVSPLSCSVSSFYGSSPVDVKKSVSKPRSLLGDMEEAKEEQQLDYSYSTAAPSPSPMIHEEEPPSFHSDTSQIDDNCQPGEEEQVSEANNVEGKSDETDAKESSSEKDCLLENDQCSSQTKPDDNESSRAETEQNSGEALLPNSTAINRFVKKEDNSLDCQENGMEEEGILVETAEAVDDFEKKGPNDDSTKTTPSDAMPDEAESKNADNHNGNEANNETSSPNENEHGGLVFDLGDDDDSKANDPNITSNIDSSRKSRRRSSSIFPSSSQRSAFTELSLVNHEGNSPGESEIVQLKSEEQDDKKESIEVGTEPSATTRECITTSTASIQEKHERAETTRSKTEDIMSEQGCDLDALLPPKHGDKALLGVVREEDSSQDSIICSPCHSCQPTIVELQRQVNQLLVDKKKVENQLYAFRKSYESRVTPFRDVFQAVSEI
jgi:hypothetical protein